MLTDFRLVIPNRPGTLVELLDAIAEAGAAIDGFCGDIRPGENWGFMHVLVQDAAAARAAIESQGVEITSEHEVDVFEVEPQLGALAAVVRRYADEGRNIEVLYMAGESQLVIGTEDMQKERFGVRMKDAKY